MQGRSQMGATSYKPVGGVSRGGPGGPVASGYFAKLDGRNGYILTTQAGGVGAAATLMAWVNCAELPSQAGHISYIVGESQYGNDLDLQFEADNKLKFFTASGGSVTFAPPPATLPSQWHLIMATMDATTESRSIYWDGRLAATDKGGGRVGKTGLLSIGASTVFGGRFFKGGIAEVAIWDRALGASEVSAIYAAASATGAVPATSGNESKSGTGPFATTAKVAVDDSAGPVKLKREEQIAIMFLGAIQLIESDCQSRTQHSCSMDQVAARLKFDPKTDPNYTYTVTASGTAWEAHANAKKPGLIGFCYFSRSYPGTTAFYNPSGNASVIDKELTGRSIDGDSFVIQ